MTPRDFCYWLQGYFQFNDATTLDGSQAEAIAERLGKTVLRAPDADEKAPLGYGFCHRLCGVFDAVDASRGLPAKAVANIKANLAEAFADELDDADDDVAYRRSSTRRERIFGRSREDDREGDACLC